MWSKSFAVCTGLFALLAGCGATEGDALDDSGEVGTSAQALFQSGQTVVSITGTAYYTQAGKHCVYSLPLGSSTASVFTGACNNSGLVDGLPGTSRLSAPYGLALDEAGGYLYVADTGNAAVRRVNLSSGRVATVVTQGAAVQAGAAAGFAIGGFGPRGLAVLDGGKVLVTDAVNHVSWVYGPAAISYLSGRAGLAADVDGTGAAARYNTPDLATSVSCSTSFFGSKCAIVSEPVTGKRRMTDASGKVTTL